eukprot:TRINITY_DN8038_c0_g1_i1.p1 TRINITY_DN8038_c0_g1~~TRINITY_DN8038_c0_g1_i1.p1  ORF type:complete len:398 (+),score=101.16 TRINITY_DN8038_c0_g1_i1:64-1257(+)
MSGASELRKRTVVSSRPDWTPPPASAPNTLLEALKQADVFPKVKPQKSSETSSVSRSVHIKTPFGAVVSVISFIVLSILVINEFSRFLNPQRVEHMKVDTLAPFPLNISFDIEFPAIPCPDVRIDVMDVTGEQQVNVLREVYKQRLTLEGEKIAKPYLDKPDADDFRIIPGVGILRLKTEAGVKLSDEGCQVQGELVVNKVAGNFHIAVGRGIKYGSKHIHHFNMSEISDFNTSHIIHKLSFGKPLTGYKDPLAGVREILQKQNKPYTGHFEYFLQVIPTMHITRYGFKVYTSQYSATTHFSRVDPEIPGAMRLPGIFVVYKLSPFMLEVVDETPSFFRFLTSLCAIVGGVITVAGLIDSLVFHFSEGTGVMKNIKQAMNTPKSPRSSRGLLDGNMK